MVRVDNGKVATVNKAVTNLLRHDGQFWRRVAESGLVSHTLPRSAPRRFGRCATTPSLNVVEVDLN